MLTVGVRMDMRYQREIRAVARFKEEGHDCNKPEHHTLVMGVRQADREHERTRDETNSVDPELFGPEAVGVVVNDIADDTTRRSTDDVQ